MFRDSLYFRAVFAILCRTGRVAGWYDARSAFVIRWGRKCVQPSKSFSSFRPKIDSTAIARRSPSVTSHLPFQGGANIPKNAQHAEFVIMRYSYSPWLIMRWPVYVVKIQITIAFFDLLRHVYFIWRWSVAEICWLCLKNCSAISFFWGGRKWASTNSSFISIRRTAAAVSLFLVTSFFRWNESTSRIVVSRPQKVCADAMLRNV